MVADKLNPYVAANFQTLTTRTYVSLVVIRTGLVVFPINT